MAALQELSDCLESLQAARQQVAEQEAFLRQCSANGADGDLASDVHT